MDGNGLGKLLPKSIAAKRRRKKQSTSGDGSGDESLRGRSIGSRETTESDGTGSLDAPDEEETSLISYESDHDSPATRPATRPTTIISTHPSQIGYLTTNSPLVQADHLQEVQKSEQQESAAPFPDLPKDPSQSARPLSASSSTGLVPPRPQSRRSPSPVGRFKEVFKPRKGSTSTASSSPERGAPRERSHSELPAREVDSSHRLPDVSALPKSNSTPDNAKVASTERFRRLSRGQKIDTTTPPRTPPTGDQATPVIVNTPPTPTDSSHPERKAVSSRDASPEASRRGAQTNASGSPQGNMISQRRARSGSGNIGPSKLSNITLAPLTPTPENGPNTPSSAGFFSSMLSAAQNATNTLSNTITNTNITSWNNSTKKTASTTRLQEGASDDNIEVEPATEVSSEHPMESKELAVNTLGKGDLSLSQLGIPEPSSSTATPTTAKFQDSTEARGRSESAPAENNYSYVSAPDSVSEDSRPRSLYDTAAPGDRTTPSSSIYEGKSGVQRSGSIRSAIGRHRKRGSSITTGGTTATGGTIAAAILAANASVAHPSAQASTPKLTGFAVANKKRNRDFHALFKSVPDDDYLIEDYGCALQRDILAHGRLYISEGHLCFSSNILGWQTTLVLSFDEIISVEKRSTALVFKNGLMISTLHVKHIFASFMSRDSVYDLIVKIWKLGHPSLQSSLNGVRIDETGGDKTEKVDIDGSIGSRSITSASDDDSEEEDDVYDEDEENDEDFETTQMTDPGLADNDGEKAVSRKPSGAVATNGMSPDKSKDAPAGAAAAGGDFPGPATHAPTECGDSGTHYDKFLADEVIPAPLGKVYSLMFGPASANFMSKWLTNEQKCTDVQMEDQKGLSQDNKTHTYTYIKPLYGAIGPKSTKCIITETIENIDLEKAVNVNCTTQTPEVPSGNVFSVKTKYCLSWAENNGTRVQANCTVEWTGKSWIKGTIEKAANEGQVQYCKDIFAALRGATSARPRVNTFTNGAGGKGKKKRKGKSTLASSPTSDTEGTARAPKTPDWGVLEPLRGILGPIVDIIGPLMTGNVVYGLLVGLLVASWFGFGFTNRRSPGGFGHDIGYYAYPDRLAAYDEIWRREESELWDWLEERVGMDRLGDGAPPVRKRAVEPRTVEEKIREDRMDDREIKEAIRVTEEKLKVLKSVVHKKGGPQAAEESGSANEHKHSVASS